MGDLKDKVGSAKSWYKSKTIIGTIMFIVPMVVKMVKPELTLDLEGGTEFVFEQGEAIAGSVDALWVQVLQAVGGFLAAFGLRTASTPLK
jgi:hypothetical protein